MQAGRELDALIAEKVIIAMAIKCPEAWLGLMDENGQLVKLENIVSHLRKIAPLGHYSTDIAAAWLVVEKIPKGRVVALERETLYGKDWMVKIDGHRIFANTAPHAICLAALAAHRIE